MKVEQAMARYAEILVDDLPHTFVHGDFTKANVLNGDDGKVYILDFSVANWYPRIQMQIIQCRFGRNARWSQMNIVN